MTTLFNVAVVVLLVILVTVLITSIYERWNRKKGAANAEAPHKIEPPKPAEFVAVPEQPKKRGQSLGSKTKKGPKKIKRKYTKKNRAYWSSKTKKAHK